MGDFSKAIAFAYGLGAIAMAHAAQPFPAETVSQREGRLVLVAAWPLMAWILLWDGPSDNLEEGE